MQSHLALLPSNLAAYCYECKRTLIFTSWDEFPPPKQDWEHGQSNTEATNTKHTKANTKNNVEESSEEEPEAGKSSIKGKSGGNKGKKARYVACFTPVLA
jgi:hypothetical protein